MIKLTSITDRPVGDFASVRVAERVLNLGETPAVATNLLRAKSSRDTDIQSELFRHGGIGTCRGKSSGLGD